MIMVKARTASALTNFIVTGSGAMLVREPIADRAGLLTLIFDEENSE